MERYNIELDKSSVIRRLDEMRQDPDCDVQVNYACAIPKQPREESKWNGTRL
jgi:hypothetical protein